MDPSYTVTNMLNRLHGQPESYDKKYASESRSRLFACPAYGTDNTLY